MTMSKVKKYSINHVLNALPKNRNLFAARSLTLRFGGAFSAVQGKQVYVGLSSGRERAEGLSDTNSLISRVLTPKCRVELTDSIQAIYPPIKITSSKQFPSVS